jgi:hypothetical protein
VQSDRTYDHDAKCAGAAIQLEESPSHYRDQRTKGEGGPKFLDNWQWHIIDAECADLAISQPRDGRASQRAPDEHGYFTIR